MPRTVTKWTSPEYAAWAGIKQRCLNKKNRFYKNYGGRGITVCARWLNSFDNFCADMGPRPSPKHSIERVNNDLGYSPENCKWATKFEQTRNTRRNVILEYNGESKCLTDWALSVGIKDATLDCRIKRGESLPYALRPVDPSWRRKNKILSLMRIP